MHNINSFISCASNEFITGNKEKKFLALANSALEKLINSKEQKAEEKLFKKIIAAEVHVLRQYLPENAITYNL